METTWVKRVGAFLRRSAIILFALLSVLPFSTAVRGGDAEIIRKSPVLSDRGIVSDEAGGRRDAAPTTVTERQNVIRRVQRELNQLGYNAGGIDGVVGPKTRQAISAYQRDKNLPANGVVDLVTLRHLGISTE